MSSLILIFKLLPSSSPSLALTQFCHCQNNHTTALRPRAAEEASGAILQYAHAVEREFQIEQR
jgi:hypothetical protein